MELPVTVIITVVQPVTALGRGIGVLRQKISYQLVIGRVKIYGLRVVVEKVARKDEDAKVYLADQTPLFVSLVPVVSLRVSPVRIVVSLLDHTHLFISPVLIVVSLLDHTPLFISPVRIVVSLCVSLASLVVIPTENNFRHESLKLNI